MERSKPKLRRWAVYTRKSSEEGLEQEFNSLHAQREACEAFIKSQAGEGWRLIRTHYDDGGLSGATMERPALQRLMADINQGLGRCRRGVQGGPAHALAGGLRQDGRSLRCARRLVRGCNSAVQYHHLDGPAHSQRLALIRA